MSYSQNNLRLQSDAPLTGGAQTWVYSSSDTLATVMASGYLSNAVDMGMKLGDVVEVHDNSTAATPVITWVRVVSVGAATVTLANTSNTGIPVNETFTALATVGAGTVLAAAIAGGAVNRTGSTAAFTDTTDTAALIIAAVPGAITSQAWEWTYYNNTLGTATLTGGTGVTVTGTLVPQNCWARYLVTIASATTVTMVQIAMGPNVALPATQFTSISAGNGTLAAGNMEGAAYVVLATSGATAMTTRTAALILAGIPNAQPGFSYVLRVYNTNAGTLTLTGGTGVTITGTATIATNVWRDYTVTINTATTLTMQNIGAGNAT